jgi:hypothetical protein
MTGDRRHIRIAAVAAALCLLASACAGSAVSTASADHSGRTAASKSPTAALGTPQLVVLGDGVSGGLGLWSFEAPDRWAALAALPSATDVGRFGNSLAIASRGSVEIRSAGTPASAGTALPLKWQGPAPTAKIAALDRSPSSAIAMVTTDGETQSYWLVATDGALRPLQPAPTQPFTPLVVWLDDTRLLVLTTDKEQVSRLAVVNVAAATIEASPVLAGIRVFAVSQDRQYLSVATESTVYAGPVAAFLGTGQPATVAAVDSSAVVWGLALDDAGTRLAMLSGTVATDGTVTSVREIGYAKGSESWVKEFDSPAPFGKAIAQVWMP